MKTRIVVVFTILLAFAISVWAADVTGKWTAQVPSRSGQARETKFNFKVEGDKLTGTMSSGERPEVSLADGKVSGDTLSFTVITDRGGTGVKQTYTGKVTGNEIQFKREGGQGAAREFVAKRAK